MGYEYKWIDHCDDENPILFIHFIGFLVILGLIATIIILLS